MVSPFVLCLVWMIFMLFPFVLGLDLGVFMHSHYPIILIVSQYYRIAKLNLRLSFDKHFALCYNCFCIVGRESHPPRLRRSLPNRVRSVNYAGKTMHPPKNSIIT